MVKTTGAPAAVQLTADHVSLTADGKDLAFITVQLTDPAGLPVPDAHNQLTFSLESPGEIVATDNGDAADMTSFVSPVRAAFSGECLVIIRGKKGQPGTIRLQAQSGWLAGATLSLQTVAGAVRP